MWMDRPPHRGPCPIRTDCLNPTMRLAARVCHQEDWMLTILLYTRVSPFVHEACRLYCPEGSPFCCVERLSISKGEAPRSSPKSIVKKTCPVNQLTTPRAAICVSLMVNP